VTNRFIAVACAIALCFGLTLGASPRANAQTAAAAAAKVCAVISGQEKADSRTLQYLLMLDEDMADANPVAIALYRDVVQSCPKAYVAYEQRLRAQNPFANGALVKGSPTNLTGSGTPLTGPSPSPAPQYPIRCRGAQGMAKASGTTLVVTFAKSARAATQGLQAGQCAWVDRGVRASEPSHIDVPLANAGDVGRGVAAINAGGLWTFWVVNTGTSLRATAVAKGTPSQKP